MKRSAVLLCTALLFQFAKSQDSLRRLEMGSTLMTINSLKGYARGQMAQERPQLEFMNGLFFRYKINRLSLRANASYSENYYEWHIPKEWMDAAGDGYHSNKDFRVGIGAQYSLLKKREWIYSFVDVSYRNIFSRGIEGGGWGILYEYASTMNGADVYAGFGSKIKILKNVYLSPELSYYMYFCGENKLIPGSFYSGGGRFRSNQASMYAAFKIHLTAQF